MKSLGRSGSLAGQSSEGRDGVGFAFMIGAELARPLQSSFLQLRLLFLTPWDPMSPDVERRPAA